MLYYGKKENTFEEICRDIVAKKFQPVYILMGEEPFLWTG